ncbi:hypothetical protein BDZ45DRAFT_677771 [Acephala macrosclerotiorum]|nr:hypothetical protein BDZ45DRAFT_677771 [Acephala macrosclerotiorum]
MATEVFRGRYADERVIQRELGKLFPQGGVRVVLERSRFLCKVPFKLTNEQRQKVLDAIEKEHYERDV